jgi:hypothetical protein
LNAELRLEGIEKEQGLVTDAVSAQDRNSGGGVGMEVTTERTAEAQSSASLEPVPEGSVPVAVASAWRLRSSTPPRAARRAGWRDWAATRTGRRETRKDRVYMLGCGLGTYWSDVWWLLLR